MRRSCSVSVFKAVTCDERPSGATKEDLGQLEVVWWRIVVEEEVGVLQHVVHSTEQKHVGADVHLQLRPVVLDRDDVGGGHPQQGGGFGDLHTTEQTVTHNQTPPRKPAGGLGSVGTDRFLDWAAGVHLGHVFGCFHTDEVNVGQQSHLVDPWEDDIGRSERRRLWFDTRRPGPGSSASFQGLFRHTCGPFLTQVADVFSELLEGRVQAFGVGEDFGGVQHEGHAVDLLPQARPLHVAMSLGRVYRLVWAELVKEERRSGAGCHRGDGSSGGRGSSVAKLKRFPALTLCPSGTKP